MEKVGLYAMEKKTVSVEDIKENFSLEKEQAQQVVGQLERIGVLAKEDNGQHKVIMDKDAFLNRIRSYKELAQRMQTIAATQSKNLVDITITKKLVLEENDHAVKTRIPGMYGENAGYLLNGTWEPGGDINIFLSSFNRVCAAPFANYYNERTVKAVVIALVVYATALLMYVTSQRNFMPGKEFGTARFESLKFANKILMDKDENFNRILSQNVKMSLDFRRLKLNGNILICGGSGAGKTFYEVKPNLMQMPHN